MNNTILLVVDVQTGLLKDNPYQKDLFIENLQTLIRECRDRDVEVVYIQHTEGFGSEFEEGTESWEIANEVKPIFGERIFQKNFNSAFYKTNLDEYLTDKNIENIILVGMQTEYCIDATCKSAFEHGFNVFIPDDANTTFDNEYLTSDKLHSFFNHKIWNNRFAKVMTTCEILDIL